MPWPDAKLRKSFAGDSMRELVRNTVDLSLALAGNLLAIVLDTSLLSIFISHMHVASDRRILIGIRSAQNRHDPGSAYANTERM